MAGGVAVGGFDDGGVAGGDALDADDGRAGAVDGGVVAGDAERVATAGRGARASAAADAAVGVDGGADADATADAGADADADAIADAVEAEDEDGVEVEDEDGVAVEAEDEVGVGVEVEGADDVADDAGPTCALSPLDARQMPTPPMSDAAAITHTHGPDPRAVAAPVSTPLLARSRLASRPVSSATDTSESSALFAPVASATLAMLESARGMLRVLGGVAGSGTTLSRSSRAWSGATSSRDRVSRRRCSSACSPKCASIKRRSARLASSRPCGTSFRSSSATSCAVAGRAAASRATRRV